MITKRISPLFVLSRQSISSSMTEPHLSCVNALLLATIRIFKIGDDDPEGRSRADFALHGYGPANGLEKIFRDVEAEARTKTLLLRREKGIKDTGGRLFIHPTAVVFNLQDETFHL